MCASGLMPVTSCSHQGMFSTGVANPDRKSTRLNSSHSQISYAVFCLKKKKHVHTKNRAPRNHVAPSPVDRDPASGNCSQELDYPPCHQLACTSHQGSCYTLGVAPLRA